MRMIMAVIQPTKLASVRRAVQELGVTDLTLCDASGYGRQRGQKPSFRGNEYKVDLLRKIVLELVVSDQDVQRVIDTIMTAAKTGSDGQIGDGKVFVLPIAQSIDL